jgi:D-inositol-3-phosphate glycosyltransferase
MTAIRPRMAFVGVAPTARGGIAQFGANLATVLARDADTAVVAYRRLYPRLSPAGRQPRDPGARHDVETLFAGLVPWEPWTWRAGASALERFAPDLVVFQWWNPLFGRCVRYLARRAGRAGARTVLVCHNASPHERFPAARVLTRSAVQAADALMALSDPVATELRALGHARPVEVLPHPPNLGASGSCSARDWRARLAPLDARPIVLFFGNVRAYKGLDDLIEAFALLDGRAQLVVAGNFFEPLARFRRRVEALGIEGCVRFWPHYVASDEAPGLFELADVVALPYRRASQSGVIAQAALAGRPVVATDVGGLPAAVGGNGLLVPPRRPEAFAQALAEALDRPPAPPPVVTWDRWAEALHRHAGVA